MFVYSQHNGATKAINDVIGDLCKKHDENGIQDALFKEGYTAHLCVGEPDIAEIDLYIAQGLNPKAIALVELGGNIATYSFESFHDALHFMKEYTPMVESILRLKAIE